MFLIFIQILLKFVPMVPIYKKISIDIGNGLMLYLGLVITLTNADLLTVEPLKINFNEISTEVQ